MVQLSSEEWSIDDEKSEMLENVLEFWDTSAEEIMTDETKLQTLSSRTTIKDATEFFIKHEFSRIPVYEEWNKDKTIIPPTQPTFR